MHMSENDTAKFHGACTNVSTIDMINFGFVMKHAEANNGCATRLSQGSQYVDFSLLSQTEDQAGAAARATQELLYDMQYLDGSPLCCNSSCICLGAPKELRRGLRSTLAISHA